MKTRFLLIATFFCCLFFTSDIGAQVTSVNYQIRYNAQECHWDAYIIVNAGSAITDAQRIQANSQFTIIVPTGDSLIIKQSYAPFEVNVPSGSGTVPAVWYKSTFLSSPAALPGSDFYSIVPTLSPTPRYNTLTGGSVVKIFSFTVENNNKCGQGIRLYQNGSDPTSSDAGMLGLDFRNGFTIGSNQQRYNANSTQLNPPSPIISSINTACTGGIEIDLTAATATLCPDTLLYAWTGPNSYVGTTQDVSINPATVVNEGTYKVVITNSFGCKDSTTIVAASKPNAGSDQTVCAGATTTISGTTPTTGTWAPQAGNPAGATLNPTSGGNASVVFTNAASGAYNFIYSTASCSDTMTINVSPQPAVSITGSNSICVGNTTTLSPNSGGTWISNNPSVATVNATSGVVTAVAQGTATFTFTNSAGCQNTTGPVTVNNKPIATNTGTSEVCIGSTTQLNPNAGGTWWTSSAAIATVTSGGLVTGVSAGTAKFVFTHSTTGCISDTITVVVRPVPVAAITGNDSICVFATTTLTPTTGGTWQSSNPLVASVDNAGTVTGVAVGKAAFRWTETSTGCSSNWTDSVSVFPPPTVSLSTAVICAGMTVNASPNTGGKWVSNNPTVATIDSLTGVITAAAQGSSTFKFTNNATGCFNNTSPLTVNPPPTVSAGSLNICIGSTTTVSPTTGGTWVSLTPNVVNLSGTTATGFSAGADTLRFTETSSGCTNTLIINVTPRPTTNLTGFPSICVGATTTYTPATGGTWSSLNPSIATINNFGLVTGVAPGSTQFVFTETSTGCPSLPSTAVTITPRPVATITGANLICIGATTTLTPSSGGSWTSSNNTVATINSSGVVTAQSAGSATFTFTDTSTGCISAASAPVTVSSPPTVSFTGPNTICVGAITNVTPTSGGTWTSSNPAVASITNLGVVTGVSAGTATLTFTETSTGCTSSPLTVTIQAKPVVSLTGPANICIDSTTTLSPTTGGAWASNNNAIATVTNGGVVTGVSQGTAIFTFTTTGGCVSDPITSIAIMPRPVVNITGPSTICIGGTTTATPNTGGTWESMNPAIATIANNGTITGVSAGSVQFRFTSSAGCVSALTTFVVVEPKPITVLNGDSTICVGKTTNLSPTVGGSWTSGNNSIATITNDGIVTGVGVGTVKFVFTQNPSGCKSDSSVVVTITNGPPVTVFDTTLCIGDTTSLTPTSGGSWASSNSAIASVTNTGIVTAISQGTVTFRFTDLLGCQSLSTRPVTVNGRPTVAVSGPSNICLNGTTNLTPNSGGTWASSNAAIASVTNAGVVTGVAVGSATFVFTLTATGCSSVPTSAITVTPAPVVGFSGPQNICVGATTTLTPSTGGTWSSSNPTIATVTNTGIVTSVSPGKVTFSFVETSSGCASSGSTDTLTITHCFNPDFNATYVNVSVPGDVRTNDNVPTATTYGPIGTLLSNPSGSLQTLTINPDGTYTFVANTEGVYVYNVPVCTPPLVTGCPVSRLTITVAKHTNPVPRPVANVDFATTRINTFVDLPTLYNDRCVVVSGCSLDPASVTVVTNPSNGGAVVNTSTGDITYTPNTGFLGLDTLVYQVCVQGSPGVCATAIQIITVVPVSALNTTIADDDFAVTPEFTPVSGNVKDNDSDPEGDTQTVTAQTTTVAAGTLVLNTDGSYTFTPVDNFTGPVEFIYRTIDNNASPDTAYATLHILVVPDLRIKARVYLEGALMNNNNALASDGTGRPLMRDNLRVSPFNGNRYIPNSSPYRVNDSLYAWQFLELPGIYDTTGLANNPLFYTIPSPSTVFGVSGQDAIVDWVFIELRSKTSNTTVISKRSALVQRDGDVVELDGIRGLRFPGLAMDDYYVVVRHRNHLGSMSKFAQTPEQLTTLVDFTKNMPLFDKGNLGTNRDYRGLAQNENVQPGYTALWGGDFDGNKKVKFENPNDDQKILQFYVTQYGTNTSGNSNFDFAFGYMPCDFDMNSKAKFDNPDDDKNMLYLQLLFYRENSSSLSNFDQLVEQIP